MSENLPVKSKLSFLKAEAKSLEAVERCSKKQAIALAGTLASQYPGQLSADSAMLGAYTRQLADLFAGWPLDVVRVVVDANYGTFGKFLPSVPEVYDALEQRNQPRLTKLAHLKAEIELIENRDYKAEVPKEVREAQAKRAMEINRKRREALEILRVKFQMKPWQLPDGPDAYAARMEGLKNLETKAEPATEGDNDGNASDMGLPADSNAS